MSLSQVEIASKTFKFHNLIETDLHPANSNCNISLSSYLRQIYITTFAATSDMAAIQSGGIADQDVQAGEFFNAENHHRSVSLTNHSRTATVVSVSNSGMCVLGDKIYDAGKHDIRIRLHNVREDIVSLAWVGMTNDPNPPSDLFLHYPGLNAWNWRFPYLINASGVLLDDVDVGQPWLSGDVLRLHLDCNSRTLRVQHERTGKSDTINNVTGPQRLFISMTHRNTAVSILPN